MTPDRTSLSSISTPCVECVSLGYSAEHKGYRCWDPVGCRMRISRDVAFDESRLFYPRPSPDASQASVIEPLSFLLFPDTPIAPMFPSHLVPSSEAPVELLVVPSPEEPSSAAPSPVVSSFSDDIPWVPRGTTYDSKPPVTRVYTRTRRAVRSSSDVPSLDEPSSSAAPSDAETAPSDVETAP